LGGNDYGRWHWVAEPELDLNASDGSTTTRAVAWRLDLHQAAVHGGPGCHVLVLGQVVVAGLSRQRLSLLEYEPVVVQQLALEADAVGAHAGGEREPEVGARQPAG
jgi:hypothetical protein